MDSSRLAEKMSVSEILPGSARCLRSRSLVLDLPSLCLAMSASNLFSQLTELNFVGSALQVESWINVRSCISIRSYVRLGNNLSVANSASFGSVLSVRSSMYVGK
jgi:hypothetical protein